MSDIKCKAKTEEEMREYEVPTFETKEELLEFIDDLVEREHDYGTCCYAMSLAATAAFNFVAGKLGVTGFQASCADLDVVRRTRRINGPFILLKGEDELYPQYDLDASLRVARSEWTGWSCDEARKKLATHAEADVHPDVWKHWKRLAKLCGEE